MPSQDKKVRWDWEYLQSLSDDTDCYQLTEKQVNFLLGLHPQYQWATRWQNIGSSTLDDWDAFGSSTLDALMRPSEDCGDSGGSLGTCFRLGTESEAFQFFPNNPYDDSDQRYTIINQRWRRLERLINQSILPDWLKVAIETFGDNLGYFPNDVMISLSEAGFGVQGDFSSPLDYWSKLTLDLNPLAQIHFECRGTGQFEIELLEVPFGGFVMISWDIEFPFEQFIDFISGSGEDEGDGWRVQRLDRNFTSLPPEILATNIQEIDFEEDGDHFIDLTFFPHIDPSPPFFYPYGGIREVEVCGLTVIGAETGEEITKQNHGLDKFIRQGAINVMATDELCEAVICAMEEIARRVLLSQDKDNLLSGVSIDKDTGVITLNQASIDRENISGTTQEKRYGGVYFQAEKVAQLFSDINGYIDIGYANPTQQKLTKDFVGIDAIEDVDLSNAWDTALGAYITAGPEFEINIDQLALRYFCEGVGSGSTSYAITDASYSEANLNIFIDLVSKIPKTTFSSWYNEGSYTPLDGYQSAPCYRFPDAQLIYYSTSDLGSTQKVFTAQPAFSVGSSANDRRRTFRVQVSGLLTGDIYRWDGMYLTALPNGVPQYDPLILRRLENGVNINGSYTPIISPPYQATGGYEVTTIVGGTTPNPIALGAIQIPPEIQSDTGVVGSITVVCKDLGHPDA